jgi:hypothetical protein
LAASIFCRIISAWASQRSSTTRTSSYFCSERLGPGLVQPHVEQRRLLPHAASVVESLEVLHAVAGAVDHHLQIVGLTGRPRGAERGEHHHRPEPRNQALHVHGLHPSEDGIAAPKK